jgi:hypothetical protein
MEQKPIIYDQPGQLSRLAVFKQQQYEQTLKIEAGFSVQSSRNGTVWDRVQLEQRVLGKRIQEQMGMDKKGECGDPLSTKKSTRMRVYSERLMANYQTRFYDVNDLESIESRYLDCVLGNMGCMDFTADFSVCGSDIHTDFPYVELERFFDRQQKRGRALPEAMVTERQLMQERINCLHLLLERRDQLMRMMGLVGQSLARRTQFDKLCRSSHIDLWEMLDADLGKDIWVEMIQVMEEWQTNRRIGIALTEARWNVLLEEIGESEVAGKVEESVGNHCVENVILDAENLADRDPRMLSGQIFQVSSQPGGPPVDFPYRFVPNKWALKRFLLKGVKAHPEIKLKGRWPQVMTRFRRFVEARLGSPQGGCYVEGTGPEGGVSLEVDGYSGGELEMAMEG